MSKYKKYERDHFFSNEDFNLSLWDIQFYKEDGEGNVLKNKDGSTKLFSVVGDSFDNIDLSDISEYVEDEDLEEIKEEE